MAIFAFSIYRQINTDDDDDDDDDYNDDGDNVVNCPT